MNKETTVANKAMVRMPHHEPGKPHVQPMVKPAMNVVT
jgi:hypothetical protein